LWRMRRWLIAPWMKKSVDSNAIKLSRRALIH
jgi:hypothetical protein